MNNSSTQSIDEVIAMVNVTFLNDDIIHKEEDDPIPTHILQLFHIAMTGVWLVMCGAGICTNVFNIRTFLLTGLDDSVTVTFFALAVSDFNVCSISFIEMIVFLAIVLEREHHFYLYITPLVPGVFLMCLRKMFIVTTILITTFLAIQRCICVVMPFHVKGLFTRWRTFFFLAVIFTFSLICHALYMWRHNVTAITNAIHNATQLVINVPPGSEPYLFLVEAFLGIALNLGCQIIVLICLIVMGIVLRKAVRFRQSNTADLQTPTGNAESRERITNSKESQALTQVSLVCSIFIITNAPYLMFGIANLILPQFGVLGAYHNLFYLAHNIMFTAELVNSSVNFFVYYKYNSKFRNYFLTGKNA